MQTLGIFLTNYTAFLKNPSAPQKRNVRLRVMLKLGISIAPSLVSMFPSTPLMFEEVGSVVPYLGSPEPSEKFHAYDFSEERGGYAHRV